MRYTILLLTLCFITLQSCGIRRITERYNIQQLQELTEKHDEAQLMDWSDFFQRRMKNHRWYKGNVGACEILFETDTYVYYGYPFHGVDRCDTNNHLIMPGTRDGIYYFKTSKQELLKYFASYQLVEGYLVRDIATGYDKALHPPLSSYTTYHFTYAISGNQILVGTQYKREHQLFPVNPRFIAYYTYIDMHTLAVKPIK